jgi:two-component system NarL family response regulator
MGGVRASVAGHLRVAVEGSSPLTRQLVAALLDSFEGISAAPVTDVRAEEDDVDLLVLEVELPVQGIAAAADLRNRFPGRNLVLLTPAGAPWTETLVRGCGAVGAVATTTSEAALALAIVSAADRGKVPGVPSPRSRPAVEGDAIRMGRLTGRERQVLVSLAMGYPPDRIALAFGITPNTVRSHVQNVLAKLEVHSRVEAVAVAHRLGLAAGHDAKRRTAPPELAG